MVPHADQPYPTLPHSSPASATGSGSGIANRSPVAHVTLAEMLGARPIGVTEPETWALLCQAVQALQDLFLSDGVSGGRFAPVVTPATLLLSSRGRVTLALGRMSASPRVASAPSGYVAPEYQPHKQTYTDTDIEKMLVFSLGECLKRAALTSHSATIQLSAELCRVLTSMGRQMASERASLMHLLDVISEYSKRREQSKPFSHIVMDLYRETIIYRNSKPILPNCALQPHLKQHMVQPCSDRNDLLSRRVEPIDNCKTIPVATKWKPSTTITQHLAQATDHLDYPRLSRNICMSLEQLNETPKHHTPIQQRPKSICTNEELFMTSVVATKTIQPARKRLNMKRNPVKRAASRLYHVSDAEARPGIQQRNCIGPEFVIRASLASKQIVMDDVKYGNLKTVTIILLNGVKLEVKLKPELTTAGQIFEKIIQHESIEENYFLGLSMLVSGDFVFLPSDVKLSKIIYSDNITDTRFTLFVRVRFFLPSLRGIRGLQSRHLLYLQLRRSILENQLPCTLNQLYELGGFALQAEFGDYSEKHEANHYFLLEHYIPETLIGNIGTNEQFRSILTQAHIQRKGLNVEKAEEDFILLAQSLPNYGVHYYSATLVSKNMQRDVWLCVCAQGISLYERSGTIVPSCNPLVYEIFKWQNIQTLCYSKHFLCILPHYTPARKSLPRKYKLKMDHKKSYYTFRLASLHHQFFLRLRTEYSSLQSLSQQFGVLLKDIKNEANSLFKMASYNTETNPTATNTEIIHFNALPNSNIQSETRSSPCRRSKSVNELTYNNNIPLEEFQNKENENPQEQRKFRYEHNTDRGFTTTIPTIPSHGGIWDKRKGVKMGTRAFTSNGQRMSRSLEAVNAWINEENEKLSLQSSSRLSNSSDVGQNNDIYVLNSSIKSLDDQFLPDFQETLSQSLMDKLKNLSFADERLLRTVTLHKDDLGSLGIQVTEGSDGKVYVQSIVPFGPASTTNIHKGDQIVAVDGQNLLNMKYLDALELLKRTDNKVELILSQISNSYRLQTPTITNITMIKQYPDKDTDCMKVPNKYEFNNGIYNKYSHLNEGNVYECASCSIFQEPKLYDRLYECATSKSNEQLLSPPPAMCSLSKIHEPPTLNSHPHHNSCSTTSTTTVGTTLTVSDTLKMNSTRYKDYDENNCDTACVPHVAFPRSLGLGRRWRGPVRYPVTPIKNPIQNSDSDTTSFLNTSDEEQIFI